MLFWVAAAFLTFAASMAVLVPLSRRADAKGEVAREINVYRDQLEEVERDVSRGLLAPEEAEQARAEIARRILKADGTQSPGDPTAPASRLSRIAAAAAVISIPLVSWGLYSVLGSPDLPQQPLAERMTRDPAASTPAELVARAERQLAANPDDLRGWEVLAPIYTKMQRYDDAANAYRAAIRLGGSSAPRQAGLGEALVYSADGLITKDAQMAFETALKDTPGMPKARFFLAMAKAQEGDVANATREWQELANSLPADDPWKGAAQAMMEQANKPAQMPGPSRQQIEDAQEMSPADRSAMIEQMVSGLDEKLRENPNDAEGWQRLIRAYIVLGRESDAAAALGRAVTAFGPQSDQARQLNQFAAQLGLKVKP
ncbi:MAG: c-type cytochrome biogenesis protein CcmI [Rhizobiaceae bacterium]|nr:c-type cytochrome biogenesis protein CcmI [Rhizobiaceae bacterium]